MKNSKIATREEQAYQADWQIASEHDKISNNTEFVSGVRCARVPSL